MADTGKQVLLRIPAYLPSEPYPKIQSPRHLQTSGGSSLKSVSSCCTSSDSTSAPQPNVPRIVQTPSKCRSGVYTYENNRSYSKMAEPLRVDQNSSSGGRKRKYRDTPTCLNPSSPTWRSSGRCSQQAPGTDFPAVPIYDRHQNVHKRGSHRFESSSKKNNKDLCVHSSNPALNVIPQFDCWPRTQEPAEDSTNHRRNYKLSLQADLPGSEAFGQTNEAGYPLRKTASMFHLNGQSDCRLSAAFDAGFKANLLRTRLDESKDFDDLLRLADGTYDGNEFDFDANTQGLGNNKDLESFQDLKISESHDAENGHYNSLQRSSSTSCTDDNSALSPLQPLHVSVEDTATLDHQADDALAELSKALEVRDFGPSQPLRPQMLPTDGRINVAEQVIARLNQECDPCDVRPSNRSPSFHFRENVHGPPANRCRSAARHPHSWNADIWEASPVAFGHHFPMPNPGLRSSQLSHLTEPVFVHGVVEREPSVQWRCPSSDNHNTAGQAPKQNSYPRVHQPVKQQAWQPNGKQFGCDEWGRNGVALVHAYTERRPAPEMGTIHTDCTENQKDQPLRHRDRKSSDNDSDVSSIDLDDRYGLGE